MEMAERSGKLLVVFVCGREAGAIAEKVEVVVDLNSSERVHFTFEISDRRLRPQFAWRPRAATSTKRDHLLRQFPCNYSMFSPFNPKVVRRK